ncbi:TetR/AcrR family transcriptional regulator [Mesobacterium sp. TK19101]|uniref:TetR/AcrR family transcriptional regulator n=1 Tax=Mesobacterium hydrothermale TaxID=3111907 RepID=A0ABU6HJ11_9RHOB|nr:TetR/AcrR family transcriptional regulator [Mesobacterium sp. TK19101]MEC3862440.1 TetR/AcrR family transcriptional regulator [Mesobacterium sp. TK19101]
MAHLEPHNARDRILVAASTLFCRQGFAATGIDTVIDAANTAKATLYKHFPSKQQLIEAVLDAEGETWRAWFFGRLAKVQAPANERMLAVFGVLQDWFSDPGFYGCPFINAVAEFESSNGAVRKAAEKHKSHLITWLTAQAIEQGLPDPKETTRTFVVLIDGAIVAAQHTRDPSFARTARRLAECHLRDVSRKD